MPTETIIQRRNIMKKRGRKLLMAVFCLLVLMLSVATVQAETTNCTAITSLPYTISTQGVYCLTGHLATNMASGNAIEITVNNVFIDLNGYKIGNLAAGNTTDAYGIYANYRQNITIQNGTIRGFRMGIFLRDESPYTTSQGHVVENVRADMNYYVGIRVEGRGNVIRDNTVVDTGGSDSIDNAYGILAQGPGVIVEHNSVIETVEKASGFSGSIFVGFSPGGVVWKNTVSNAAFGPGSSRGIYFVNSSGVFAQDNRISKMNYGIYFVTSSGKYMGNLTFGCTTDFDGGTPIGVNN